MVTKASLKDKKILVTCGPTWVAIDDVRVISNRSTGESGHTIVERLNKEGSSVTLLEGPVTHVLKSKPSKIIKFLFYDELQRLLKKELEGKYDIVIHAAAVSDYQPKNAFGSKLSSAFSQIKLHLVPTAKLIEKIKKRNPKAFLVGFKLETHFNKELLLTQARHLAQRAHCNLVIANCQKGKDYLAYIIDQKRNILATGRTRRDVARNLVKILKERV